ncbi:MAG: phytoene/squalene synthase family protein [candidate division WOR-3 bacterium]
MVDYKFFEKIISKHASTFYLASLSLPKHLRYDFWVIYSYCRLVDEISDHFFIINDKQKALDEIYKIKENLILAFEGNYNKDNKIFLGLKEIFRKYKFDISPFLELIEGAIWDIEGIEIGNLDDLMNYSKLVAGSVGAMLFPIISNYKDEDILKSAYNFGIFMQIVNILRDVGEDYKIRRRIYIPKTILNEFSVKEFHIKNGLITPNYVDMLEFLMEIAEKLFYENVDKIKFLREEIRKAIYRSGIWYLEILNAIRFNNYDNINKRAYVNKFFKFLSLFFDYRIKKEILKRTIKFKFLKFEEKFDVKKDVIVSFHSDFSNASVNLPFGKIITNDSKIENEKIIEFIVDFGIFKKKLKLFIIEFNEDELVDYFENWFHIHRFYDNKVIEIIAYKIPIPKFIMKLFLNIRYRRLKDAISKYIFKRF